MGGIGLQGRAAFGSVGLMAVVIALATLSTGSVASPAPQGGPGGSEFNAQWAEVLTVTDTWMVLRNRDGEQYPVAFDAIGTFIVRWPTTVDRISPLALVEVTGRNIQSNRILTEQVDVFEGGARDMVRPGLLMTTNQGYPIVPMDFMFNADAYGAPFPGLENRIQGNQIAPSSTMHIVGPLVNRVPLMVGLPLQTGFAASNNAFMIVPGNAGLHLSQVTRGTPSMVRPGDLVYFVASSARPRSLILPQLVVYKRVPIDRFDPLGR